MIEDIRKHRSAAYALALRQIFNSLKRRCSVTSFESDFFILCMRWQDCRFRSCPGSTPSLRLIVDCSTSTLKSEGTQKSRSDMRSSVRGAYTTVNPPIRCNPVAHLIIISTASEPHQFYHIKMTVHFLTVTENYRDLIERLPHRLKYMHPCRSVRVGRRSDTNLNFRRPRGRDVMRHNADGPHPLKKTSSASILGTTSSFQPTNRMLSMM